MSAGGSLPTKCWPGAAKFAVAISVDLDHETPWEGHGAISPQILSAAEYGARRGLPRILSVLEDEGIPASFFVPAMAMKRYPEEIAGVMARGHEVALHGLRHERSWPMSELHERETMYAACEIFEEVAGYHPRGYRAPSLDPSPTTLSLLEELGFVYDSSLMSDDDPYTLVAYGKTMRVVEVPVEWTRDDATYFSMDRWSSIRPSVSTGDVAAMWRADWHRASVEGGLFQLTLHPDIIGHRSRINLLTTLLREIRAAAPPCWFATHEAVAMHCLEKGAHEIESR